MRLQLRLIRCTTVWPKNNFLIWLENDVLWFGIARVSVLDVSYTDYLE